MNSRDAKAMLGLLWFAAAALGVLIGAVSLINSDDPNSRLLAVLLILGCLPFGLMRPSVPWLWSLVVAWPTVVLGIINVGWVSALLLIPAVVGSYLGDWIATWWAEAHPKTGTARGAAAAPLREERAADGTHVADDGLPPAMPERWSSNLPDGR